MRWSSLVLLFLPALAACSASLEALATTDTDGNYGAQVTVELGIAVSQLDGARQIEVSTGAGVAADERLYGHFHLGLQYSDAHLGDDFGQRVGLHLAILADADPESRDALAGLGVSWSLLANLDGTRGGLPHSGVSWYARDQLGVTLFASHRWQMGHGSADRTVFGVGPRYTLVLGGE